MAARKQLFRDSLIGRLTPVPDLDLAAVCAGGGGMSDAVNQPEHYTSHPSGVECIEITEEMSFCVGNAIKYLWRADLKGNALEDLKKARYYVDREIKRRGGE